MRKFTLLLVALFIVATTFAQRTVNDIHLTPRDANFKWIKAPKPNPAMNEAVVSDKVSYASSSVRVNETIIGSTKYDLQTNRAISNRFLRNSDGTLSATWTTYCPGGSSGTNRGTGYNYYDGTSWLTPDCNRIEPATRSGFTNIGITSSGKELTMTHTTSSGMLITSRPAKGTGAWTEDGSALGNNANDTWSKMAVGGSDGKTIHALWQTTNFAPNVEYCGQLGAVAYSRSTDEGVTWPILHQCISEIDTPYYLGFSADEYAIATQGKNVALLFGDWTTDLILLKSTDNGDTWTKTILWKFPIPLYDDATMVIDTDEDGTPDIIPVPDGDGRIEYDKNGMLHVVFSEALIGDDTETGLIGYYPDADGGLWYWNENDSGNPPVMIAAAEDLNGDGVLNYPAGPGDGTYYGSGTYGGGLTLQPTIGFDEANNIYITYSTYDELSDTTAYGSGHRHVYVISSFDGGVTWSTPYDVVPSVEEGGDGENQEAVFACMASSVDNLVRIIYQRDPAPGHSLSNLPTEAGWNTYTSDIVYVELGPGELVGTPSITSNNFSVSVNTPNPFSDQTQFNITLQKQSSVNLKVTNVLGQVVFNENTNFSAGNHVYNFNRANLSSGVYNFMVNADGEKITKKIIVE